MKLELDYSVKNVIVSEILVWKECDGVGVA
jgi:hypothetical protein